MNRHYWPCPYCTAIIPLFRQTDMAFDGWQTRIKNHLTKRHLTAFERSELSKLVDSSKAIPSKKNTDKEVKKRGTQ